MIWENRVFQNTCNNGSLSRKKTDLMIYTGSTNLPWLQSLPSSPSQLLKNQPSHRFGCGVRSPDNPQSRICILCPNQSLPAAEVPFATIISAGIRVGEE